MITPERIAELRGLCNVPSAEMVARARLRTFRKRTDALTTLGLSLHALPELLDEIDRLRYDNRRLLDVLQRHGFRTCDIPACNCNSWHHVGGYAERFREIDEAVGDHNGKTLLDAVQEKLDEIERLRAVIQRLHDQEIEP